MNTSPSQILVGERIGISGAQMSIPIYGVVKRITPTGIVVVTVTYSTGFAEDLRFKNGREMTSSYHPKWLMTLEDAEVRIKEVVEQRTQNRSAIRLKNLNWRNVPADCLDEVHAVLAKHQITVPTI